ncbi:unnamed protein product [Mytilus edulis]|uniref:Uncharacterized protein n=1 Tax=Mytilus edulis TaxID=6550 RepID=A0A8S3S6B9_MYTED|nr:unnamed protein product [Mytilus edulis]
MHAFENCFQPKPHAIETNNVYDVTNWIKVWLECNGSEKNILKAIPNTCPFFMPMNDDQIDVDRLKSDINKVNKQNGCAKDGWWTSFFTDIESMYFTTSTCKGGTDGDCKAVKLYPSELHGRDCENKGTDCYLLLKQGASETVIVKFVGQYHLTADKMINIIRYNHSEEPILNLLEERAKNCIEHSTLQLKNHRSVH